MFPSRFAIGAICALALTIAFLGPRPHNESNAPQTAPQTSMVTTTTIAPSTTTSTTTSTTSTTTSTTWAPALVGPDIVCSEWAPMMLEEGWPADREILETALTIMYRESRCIPTVDSGPDHGLFQINRFWMSEKSNPPYWLAAMGIAQTHDELFDPRINIRAALAIYRYSCERNGPDQCFAPWTTWSGN